MRGGSESVYFGTSKLLEAHGHKSLFFSMHHQENSPCEISKYFVPYIDLNMNSNGIMGQLRTAGRIIYCIDAKKRLSKLLDQYPVDVAHLHNIHHQISPSILHEFRKRNIPVVMTLHDYKMVCASYSMLVNERPCEACSGERYFEVVKKRCVKDSLAKSIIASLEMYLHHKIFDIYDNIDIFISPSMFLKCKLEEMGFRKEIVYLPNFIDMKKFEQFKEVKTTDNSIVYFGRLSFEKGLWTLLEAVKILNAKVRIKVKIIGDGAIRGELEGRVKDDGIDNVRFLGYLKGERLYSEIRKSLAVVLPSEWYENNPISAMEAFALKKPLIGSRIGGIPELVKNGETGYTFEPGNAEDLSEKIKKLLLDDALRIKMGHNARRFVETKLNPEKHYNGLMIIYQQAMEKY